jgi:hypothetical protein|tara:strand:- start:21781 stop:22020 length:240 start_codon:yes stop_codon:yes gene_type:complete
MKRKIINLTDKLNTFNSEISHQMVQIKLGVTDEIKEMEVIERYVDLLEEEVSYLKYLLFRYDELQNNMTDRDNRNILND